MHTHIVSYIVYFLLCLFLSEPRVARQRGDGATCPGKNLRCPVARSTATLGHLF